MRIESLRIKNLRSFSDEIIRFNDYTCLVGANGSGKSTVLCALNVLFREGQMFADGLLDEEDFHNKNVNEPIEITATFTDLSDEAKKDLSDYVRQSKLVVSAIAQFDKVSGKATVKQYGQRLGMSAFAPFFKAFGDGAKVADLKTIYSALRNQFADLHPHGTKDAMKLALQEYEAGRPEQCELQLSDDEFYGISRGANRLSKYLQWVYVPAVKDASTEQLEARNTALGKLLARTVRAKTDFSQQVDAIRLNAQTQYQNLLDENQHVLSGISNSLKSRLVEWANPEATIKLEWRQDPDKSVRVEEPFARIIAGEGNFEGNLARFGHGLQRSYLLALLHELAGVDDVQSPRLILGCEEPELYQHPPQARHLAAVLQRLGTQNAQIIVSIHSPLFVSGDGFEDVRLVRKDYARKCSSIANTSYQDISADISAATGEPPKRIEGLLAKIHQALQPALSEMFFAARLVLVEGLEDVAYLTSYLHLMGKWDDYRRLGCHIVPVNGKSELVQPLAIAKRLKIPTYIIFDSDGDKPDRSGSRAKHDKDNSALLGLLGQASAPPFPKETLEGIGFTMWSSDIASTVEDDIGRDTLEAYRNKADAEYGSIGGLRKNTLHISTMLALAWNDGKRSVSLERVCSKLIDATQCVS